jgi:predicted ArsR family transcriptional regulator
MLSALFGNKTAEKILLSLRRNREDYALALAGRLGLPVNQVQQQLKRLEKGQVLVSRSVGRTRLYQIDPRRPFARQLEALLDTGLSALDAKALAALTQRKRPRRAGKP